jgi:hypothetical protein
VSVVRKFLVGELRMWLWPYVHYTWQLWQPLFTKL